MEGCEHVPSMCIQLKMEKAGYVLVEEQNEASGSY